jgi:SAM-dependent methyltransferase
MFRRLLRFRRSVPPGPPAGDAQTMEDLLSWENQDIPTVDRASDAAEAVADEKQDVTTSLNFPLHWTTAKESWDYLFDFSIACELLAPRPDDLVLDFAAGTCWATEFLGRVGVRTVSVDLSIEMMRRGKHRLASDSRLVFRDDALFVAARGQSLPFLADSFDGVICMNALHHLPSYARALREIHRILKPGGRAVFSEPGTGHAAEPMSRFRMREERVIEKSVSLPMIRRLAIDAGFSKMRVVPLRSAGGYVLNYSADSSDGASCRQMWEETLRSGPIEHARFVLHKGDDLPADTLLPAHQLTGRLKARIVLEEACAAVRAGAAFTDRLRVTNAGNVTWRARGRRFGGQVTIGLKVCDSMGNVLREDLGRTPLPRDVAPGEEIRIEMTVAGLLPPGQYGLRYDAVVEGVTWFEFHGSQDVRRTIDVTAF